MENEELRKECSPAACALPGRALASPAAQGAAFRIALGSSPPGHRGVPSHVRGLQTLRTLNKS